MMRASKSNRPGFLLWAVEKIRRLNHRDSEFTDQVPDIVSMYFAEFPHSKYGRY